MVVHRRGKVIALAHNNRNTTLTLYNGKEMSLNRDRLEYHTNQHLYVYIKDKIEELDWFLINGCLVRQCAKRSKTTVIDTIGGEHHESVCEKIVCTTDTLYRNATQNLYVTVAHLPIEFILKFVEYYNKGEVISDVVLEYEDAFKGYQTWIEKIDTPPFHGNLKLKLLKELPYKPIKTSKPLWTFEEVEEIVRKAFLLYKADYTGYPGLIESSKEKENAWINENLLKNE